MPRRFTTTASIRKKHALPRSAGATRGDELVAVRLSPFAVVLFPVRFGARLQLGLFLFGFRLFDQPEHSDHLAVSIESERTAPANQPVHVVLHVYGHAKPYAAA